MDFRDELEKLLTASIQVLDDKREGYGDSWKKRGGVGAFMVIARKWDRIEHAAKENGWNLFEALRISRTDLLDDICDLRNYLTLVQHEVVYGQREGNSDASFTPDSQESPGASAEELGVGDNGDSENARRVSLSAARLKQSGRGIN
jgi:hypothetical protein